MIILAQLTHIFDVVVVNVAILISVRGTVGGALGNYRRGLRIRITHFVIFFYDGCRRLTYHLDVVLADAIFNGFDAIRSVQQRIRGVHLFDEIILMIVSASNEKLQSCYSLN